MLLQDIIPTIQLAIGPVILISGIGLLLLSMTNRFGRVVDRTRQLTRELRSSAPEYRETILGQLPILLKRAVFIRASIALATISVLMAALLIVVLFASTGLQLETPLLVIGLFITCMSCLIASLVLLVMDINLSLRALKLEVHALVGREPSQADNAKR